MEQGADAGEAIAAQLALARIVGPVDDPAPALDGVLVYESPHAAVEAVEPVVSHHEQVARRNDERAAIAEALAAHAERSLLGRIEVGIRLVQRLAVDEHLPPAHLHRLPARGD